MTTDISIENRPRVFMLGHVPLRDPAPSMSIAEVLALYTKSYPILEHATVGAPRVVGDELHYEIETPPGKTKG